MDGTVATSGAVGPEAEVARLRWRCRRGMRELDVMLTRYLDRVWPTASSEERAAFVSLLELQDPDLWSYLVGRSAPSEEQLRAVVACLRGLGP